MFLKNNKGQSALEYLMTYGWAVIAILVVIGLLYWLTSQQASSQANCATGFPNVSIIANSLTKTGLQMQLVNGTGKSITSAIVGAKFTQGQTVKNVMSANPGSGATMASGTSGSTGIFTLNPTGGLASGDTLVDLNLTYNDGIFDQAATAQCRGKIA